VPADAPDPRDFEVDNETRIVVLGSNLEYVNQADLTLEMNLPTQKPKMYMSFTPSYTTHELGWRQAYVQIQNIGEMHSRLEYKVYFSGFGPEITTEGTITRTPGENIDTVGYADYCFGAGTTIANFKVVYKTGEVDQNGVEISETVDKVVTITCEFQPIPLRSY
jgi:hypothetical protein